MEESLWILLAIVGWVMVFILLSCLVALDGLLKEAEKKNREYFVRVYTFCERTYKIMKDWHLEGGFVCDKDFQFDFEREIWRDDKN